MEHLNSKNSLPLNILLIKGKIYHKVESEESVHLKVDNSK